MTDDTRRGRGRPKGGRRATDPIFDLQTHPAPYVTIEELARYWKVSTRSLYAAVAKGSLEAIRVGRQLRIKTQAARAHETAA